MWLNCTKVFSCRQQNSILDMWIDNFMFSLVSTSAFARRRFIKVRFRAITRPFAWRQSEAVRFGGFLILLQFQPLPHHTAHSVEKFKLTMRHSLHSPNKMGLRLDSSEIFEKTFNSRSTNYDMYKKTYYSLTNGSLSTHLLKPCSHFSRSSSPFEALVTLSRRGR